MNQTETKTDKIIKVPPVPLLSARRRKRDFVSSLSPSRLTSHAEHNVDGNDSDRTR